MNKKRFFQIILLMALIVVFSSYCFYGMNCFITVIFNYENSFNFPIIFATLPHVITIIQIITFLIWLIHYIKYDSKYRAHQMIKYAYQIGIEAVIGLIFTIISGACVYKNFLISNPNPGVLIIFIVNNCVLISLAIAGIIYAKKLIAKGGQVRHVSSAGHRWFTALFALLLFFALNRFGAFLCSFIYMDYNYFGLIFPFFISLISPLAIVVLLILKYLDIGFKKKRSIFTYWSICALFSITSGLYTIIMGINNPLLISLTSAAMPIERIATLPIDATLLFGVGIIVPFVMNIKLLIDRKKILKSYEQN